MPLEQIKTQVLLLHSEQTALDKLRAGFNDRYTVHCATSGFEALNTLGETPIHVIVSAHALPGMSGVEALREAKKRSPETVGILLTGDGDPQIEGLAGDKDIFQIIRGGIDPRHITQLVDAATQQVGMMPSAANDQAADSDSTAEHIVIETGDNGSTIISDGTGAFATLPAEKMAERLPEGAQAVGVLVMTKDEDFLQTIKDCCRGLHAVHFADSIRKATELLTRNTIGVSVIDASLVGPNVEKLALHLQAAKSRLVPIVAGRREDGEMLMDLINRGKVYRFLLKPASPGRVRLALEASVKHHLEGPDSAFKKVAPTPAPPPTPAARKPAPAPAAKVEPKPAAPAPTPIDNTPAKPTHDEVHRGLSGAFDDDDSRFASTVSMIVSGQNAEIKPADGAVDPLDMASDDDSLLQRPAVLGGMAVAVLAAAGLAWVMMSGSDETVEPLVPTTVDAAPSTVQRDEAAIDTAPATAAEPSDTAQAVTNNAADDRSGADTPTVDAMPAAQPAAAATGASDLEAARAAVAEGRLYLPVGNNALELYSEAIQANPDNSSLTTELNTALDASLIQIETALVEGNLAEVKAGLDQVTLVKPDHPRLPLLLAQLSKAEVRDALDAARNAVRAGRFSEARSALNQAATLGASASELSSIEQDLASARSSSEVDGILSRASQRLANGQLTTPAGNSARDLYADVLARDPNNLIARQGLASIATKLALNARNDIDAGRLDSAEQLLKQAATIDASSSELEASWQALEDARNAVSQAEAAEAEAARTAAEEQAAAERETQRIAEERASRPVPVSSLNRTRYVAAKYPRAAERRGLDGWVDLIFTVGTDGKVKDIEIMGSEPGEIFVDSATDAVKRWEFEPVVQDGQVVEKRAVVRLGFALE